MRGKKKQPAQGYPKYSDMIVEAIVALQERTGSSPFAIRKFIAEKWELPDGWEQRVGLNLKKMSTEGLLKKERASFKLGDSLKKAVKAKVVVKKMVVPAKTKGKKATASTGATGSGASGKAKKISKARGAKKQKKGPVVKPKAVGRAKKGTGTAKTGRRKDTKPASKIKATTGGGVKKVKKAGRSKGTTARAAAGGRSKAKGAAAGSKVGTSRGKRSSRGSK